MTKTQINDHLFDIHLNLELCHLAFIYI
jgi:hypothetical protein